MGKPSTGNELADAIERWLPALRMLGRLPVGQDLQLPTGECTIIVGSGTALRQALWRNRKRDTSVYTDVYTSVTAPPFPPHTPPIPETPVSLVSDPDLSSLPGSSPEKLTGGARGRAKSKARTALPEDWEPKTQHIDRAVGTGLDLAFERDKFRSHHTAKGSLMANWDAAFTTWLMGAPRYGSRVNGTGGARVTGTSTQASTSWDAKLDAYEADLTKASRQRAESGTQALPLWFSIKWPDAERMDRACMARVKAEPNEGGTPGEVEHETRRRRQAALFKPERGGPPVALADTLHAIAGAKAALKGST